MSLIPDGIEKTTINNLRKTLDAVLVEQVKEDTICVLLSGGADSTLVALAAHHLGKKIHALSYQLGEETNPDCDAAQKTCETMGWKFDRVSVPADDSSKWFIKLVDDYGCRKKIELEVLYPVIFLIDRAKTLGFKQVLTGFGSPSPHGRDGETEARKDISAYWNRMLDEGGVISSATAKCVEYASNVDVEIVTPLTHPDFIRCLFPITYEQVNKPYPKSPYKLMYQNDFQSLGLLKTKYRNLQKSADIQAFFENVFDVPAINTKQFSRGNGQSAKTSKMNGLIKQRLRHIDPIKHHTYTMADVWDKADEKLFSVISLFAGGGGSSTGYKLAGGDVLLANEFVPEAIKTYRFNYPHTPVVDTDIRTINKTRDHIEGLFDEYELDINNIDILDGSPPCSTFSLSGKGEEAISKKNVKYSDVTQDRIGMLIHDYVFFASCVQPKICIIENVGAISKSDPFRVATDALRRNGFLVNHRVLNAVRFGVAQTRERMFCLAIREDVAAKVGIQNEKDILSLYPDGSDYEVSVREALEGVEIDRQERNYLLKAARKGVQYEMIRAVPKNPPKSMRMRDIDKSWSSDFNLRRLAWHLPASTLTATDCQTGLGGHYHPEEDRIFTIKELLRLQGLPEDFHLTGTRNQKGERIGRMVPPLMTKHLAQSLYEKVILPSQ